MIELIPAEKLDDGFERAKFLVESFIESSNLAFDKHHYQISIGLSILAYEEIFKMQMFFMALQKNEGIKKEDWDSITKGNRQEGKSAHIVKYERSYLDRKKFIEERGFYEHLATERILKKFDKNWQYQTFNEKTKRDPQALKRLRAFSKIKNACFYLDWKDNDWQIFTKVSKLERKALAELLLWMAEFQYCVTVLDKKNPTIIDDVNSESFQRYVNDPLFKKQQELQAAINTPKFMKIRSVATSILDQYS